MTLLISQNRSVQTGPVERIELSLRSYLQTVYDDKAARYAVAFQDLDGDGIPEAIVYVVSRDWCGSGGCNTMILSHVRESWKVITEVRITRPPIRLLRSKSNGWYDLGVWVQGGGIQPGYEAQLRFDGKTYPENPTVPPANPLAAKVPGSVMISHSQKLMPLYPEP